LAGFSSAFSSFALAFFSSLAFAPSPAGSSAVSASPLSGASFWAAPPFSAAA
jgi:hypothetical protein